MRKAPSTLDKLASVLQASPESDALVILGRLLDSLPIGFHLTNCGPAFEILYANRTWEQWLGSERLPVAGKTLSELFPGSQPARVLEIMGNVCATAKPEHLKQFEFGELKLPEKGARRQRSLWDWEIYPLTGPSGEVTHLLNVVMSAAEPSPAPGRKRVEDRQAENRRREAASGVLRIFGVAPEPAIEKRTEVLSQREHEVAELMAMGFTNAAIGRRLNVSSATVSSHAAHILAKLGFRSRAQVAAWIVARRLARGNSAPEMVENP
ncbi:MAG TPA: LuxR C-terminal-related transcriptional regulator [Candidatus Dormibacteraeota bacterium]